MRIWAISTFLFIVSCTSKNDTLKIACAANMEEAIDSIAVNFTQETGIKTEVISGATGTLSTQIENGAPYHIFIAADPKYTDHLAEIRICSTAKILAYGQLMIVVNKEVGYDSLHKLLMDVKVQKIGLPDPEVAPFGKVAKDVILRYAEFDAIEHKIVYAESVDQINSFIRTGAVDVAFTANSFDQKDAPTYERLDFEELKDKLYRVPQTVGVIYQDKKMDENAKSFIDFLNTSQSSEILEYFGYTLAE